jgi:ribosomal protein L32E
MKRKKTKFLRAGYWVYSKLGLRRNKKLKYRRSNGIDNKVRLRMKGHLRNVSIGFRNEKNQRHLLNGLSPKKVNNLSEMEKVSKEEIAVIGNIGNRKKMELMEYSLKHNVRVYNINPKKFVEKIKHEMEKKKEEKLKKEGKKKEKEKRAKESEKKVEKESEKTSEKPGHKHEEVKEETKLEETVKDNVKEKK